MSLSESNANEINVNKNGNMILKYYAYLSRAI